MGEVTAVEGMPNTVTIVPALGGSPTSLAPFLTALGTRVEAHVLCPPGFGDASRPVGWPSTRRLAAAVRSEVADRRAATVLLGISLGGMVAQWLALDHSRHVRALLLASTTHVGVGALASSVKMLRLARCFVRSGVDGGAHACLVEEVVGVPRHAPPEAYPELRRSRSELLWLSAAAVGHRAPVEQLSLPCFVLTGADDTVVSPESQARMTASTPGARHEILAGVGHDVAFEAPGRTANWVMRCLAAIGPRSSR